MHLEEPTCSRDIPFSDVWPRMFFPPHLGWGELAQDVAHTPTQMGACPSPAQVSPAPDGERQPLAPTWLSLGGCRAEAPAQVPGARVRSPSWEGKRLVQGQGASVQSYVVGSLRVQA